jgi:hypothetical protein
MALTERNRARGTPIILNGQRVVLRPASADDVDRVTSILQEPAVAHRWGTFDEARVAEEFVGDDRVFIVEVDGNVIGSIQYSEENEPMYRHAGIDILPHVLPSPPGLRHGRHPDARPVPVRREATIA